MYYEVGDAVTFTTPDGTLIGNATVTARVDRLWDGRAGFIAVAARDERVWGLDDEITNVERSPSRHPTPDGIV